MVERSRAPGRVRVGISGWRYPAWRGDFYPNGLPQRRELAYADVCGRCFCVRARSLSWRIAALNLVGSIAFGVSAATSLIVPSTNEPVSAAIANAGTAVGALCFLAGGLMLLPEAAQED